MGKAKRTLGVILAALMLVVTCMTYVPASAAVVLPTVKFVGLENIPAAVGEDQNLMLTSNFDGNVQYQVFYVQRNDPSKAATTTWTKLGDWTTAADAKTPVVVKVPAGTVTVAGNYSFAIRVKRAGVTGQNSNSYGDFDSAYAFNYVFAATATEGLKAAKLASAEVAIGDKFVISGLTAGNSYKLFTLNEARAQRWDAAPVATSTTNTIEWAPTVAGSYVLDLQLVDAAGKVTAVKLFNVKVTDKFQITSVTALNAKQLAVTFNKAVKTGTATYGAQNTANYAVNGTAPTRISLDSTGKVATLTFTLGLANGVANLGKYYQVDIADVKTADGTAVIDDYSNPIYIDDSTKPTATVSYSAPEVLIDFSEPMSSAGTTTLDDATVAVDGFAYAYTGVLDSTTDTLKGIDELVLTGLTAGTHRIDIVGAKDLAGNYMVDLTTTVTVSTDTVKPTVTSLTASGSVLTVKFSEYVTVPEIDVTVNGIPANYTTSTTPAVTAADTTNTIYTLNLDSTILGTPGWINASVVVGDALDASGLEMTDTTAQSFILTKDLTGPSISSITTSGANLIIKFSEPIVSGVAPANLAVKFIDSDGVVHSYSTATAVLLNSATYYYDANNDGDHTDAGENCYLVLNFTDAKLVASSAFMVGSYTVTVPSTILTDAVGNNASSNYSVAFSVTSGASATATLGVTPTQVSPGVLSFDFTANLTSAALNANNFKINGQPLPAGTKLYFYGSKDIVYAELPASYIGVTGNRTLSVANIVDEDGNALTSAAKTGSLVPLTENVSPVAKSVILSTDKIIKVEMSENIADPATADGIEVYVNGVLVDSTLLTYDYEVGTYGTLSRLTITSSASSTFAPTQTIVVKFVSGCTVTDAAGNAVTVGQVQK